MYWSSPGNKLCTRNTKWIKHNLSLKELTDEQGKLRYTEQNGFLGTRLSGLGLEPKSPFSQVNQGLKKKACEHPLLC